APARGGREAARAPPQAGGQGPEHDLIHRRDGMRRAIPSGVGKNRYTLNQDYFKLSGSAPESTLAERARQVFSVTRARQRMTDAFRRHAAPVLPRPGEPAPGEAQLAAMHVTATDRRPG